MKVVYCKLVMYRENLEVNRMFCIVYLELLFLEMSEFVDNLISNNYIEEGIISLSGWVE